MQPLKLQLLLPLTVIPSTEGRGTEPLGIVARPVMLLRGATLIAGAAASAATECKTCWGSSKSDDSSGVPSTLARRLSSNSCR